MTFELLFKDKFVLKNPWVLIPASFLFAIVGQILGQLFFSEYASIVGITFATIPLVQIFMQLIKDQEKHIIHDHKFVLKHSILLPFVFMFIGLCLSYTFMYSITPTSAVEDTFSSQIQSIYDSKGPFAFITFDDKAIFYDSSCEDLGMLAKTYPDISFDSCHEADFNKNAIPEIVLSENNSPKYVITENNELYYYKTFLGKFIFLNNLGVLLFIFMTSFMFGTGAIFILVWNASIVGVFIGDAIKKSTSFISGNITQAFTLDLGQIVGNLLIHGIFELTGFFIAAIAGGILGISMLKHNLRSKEFHTIFFTSLVITLISVVIVLLGAIIESYV